MKFITIIAFASVCFNASAQILYNNGAAITVKSACTLQVNGDITTNAGSLQNDGTVTLKGNLTNNVTMTLPYNGTLTFNGTVAQSVGGSSPFLAENVVFNNTVGITLNAPLKADAVVTFNNGLITNSSSNPLTITANGSVSGAKDASHVNGTVVKEGTGSFTFPIGNTTKYQPVTAALSANNTGLAARYFAADAGFGAMTNGGTEATALTAYNTREYWDVSPLTTATGTVTVYWDGTNDTFFYALPQRRVAHKAGGNWLNEGGTSTGANLAGSITSNSIGTWGSFAVGSIGMILPLQWLSLNGTVNTQKQAALSWQVQEQYVARYQVEKSADGRSFSVLGSVNSKGNGINDYNYTEALPLSGIAYYRIHQWDIDGHSSYSAIVKLSTAKVDISIYPNPVKDKAVIAGVEPGMQVRLLNGAGQILVTQKANANSITLNIEKYPNGLYQVQVYDATGTLLSNTSLVRQ